MAVTAKVHTFTGGSTAIYDVANWNFAESEFDDFATAVNAHTSNSTRQLSRPKGNVDSTDNEYKGLMVLAQHPTYDNYGARLNTNNSATTVNRRVISAWTDTTANQGWGSYTNEAGGATSSVFDTSVRGAVATCVYDDTEGSEFFHINYAVTTTIANAFITVFKDTNGDWVFICGSDELSSLNNYCIGVGPLGLSVFGACPNWTLVSNSSAINVVEGLIMDNEEYTTSANRVTARYAVECANTKVGVVDTQAALTAFSMVGTTKDYVAIGGGFAFDFNGVF